MIIFTNFSLYFWVQNCQGKIYGVFGWEYRKPERVPPACPYKPAAKKVSEMTETLLNAIDFM